MAQAVAAGGAARTSYHHGDLRNALIRAAVALAEQGGPDAVTIRAAARAAGVTPTAAYRHFSGHSELLAAAKELAISELTRAIRRCIDEVVESGDPVRVAVHRAAAIGRGYVQFALAEPGLFRTAFCLDAPTEPVLSKTSEDDHPLGMLAGVLDELARVGFMDAAQRPLAEIGAWSTVHGLAMLLVDGPLTDLPAAERDLVVHRTIALALRGLGEGPAADPVRSTDSACTGRPPVPELDLSG